MEQFSIEAPLGGRVAIRVGLAERAINTSDFTLGAEAKLSVSSGVIWVYDADVPVEGVVDSATSSSVTDATLASTVANLYRYMRLQFTSNTQLQNTEWFVTAYNTSGVLTVDVGGVILPATPVAGDTFRIPGTPLLPPTAMSVASGIAYYVLGPSSGVTTKPGRKVAHCLLTCTTTGGDTVEYEAQYVIDVV